MFLLLFSGLPTTPMSRRWFLLSSQGVQVSLSDAPAGRPDHELFSVPPSQA